MCVATMLLQVYTGVAKAPRLRQDISFTYHTAEHINISINCALCNSHLRSSFYKYPNVDYPTFSHNEETEPLSTNLRNFFSQVPRVEFQQNSSDSMQPSMPHEITPRKKAAVSFVNSCLGILFLLQ